MTSAPLLWLPLGFLDWLPATQAVTLGLLTFVQEDVPAVSAALLAAAGSLSWSVGFLGVFLGIWVGDALLYLLGSSMVTVRCAITVVGIHCGLALQIERMHDQRIDSMRQLTSHRFRLQSENLIRYQKVGWDWSGVDLNRCSCLLRRLRASIELQTARDLFTWENPTNWVLDWHPIRRMEDSKVALFPFR